MFTKWSAKCFSQKSPYLLGSLAPGHQLFLFSVNPASKLPSTYPMQPKSHILQVCLAQNVTLNSPCLTSTESSYLSSSHFVYFWSMHFKTEQCKIKLYAFGNLPYQSVIIILVFRFDTPHSPVFWYLTQW